MCSRLQLDLSNHRLGPDGARALATGLGGDCSLTRLVLKNNNLGPGGAQHLSDALKINKSITELDISNGGGDAESGIEVDGACRIAEMLGLNHAMTSIDVRHNNIKDSGALQLSAAVLGSTKLEAFNEIPIKAMRIGSLTTLDLRGKVIGIEGGMVVAGLIPLMDSLRSVWATCIRALSALSAWL